LLTAKLISVVFLGTDYWKELPSQITLSFVKSGPIVDHYNITCRQTTIAWWIASCL